MRRDPYRIIEGLAIAAFAVGATDAYFATKRSFVRELAAVRRAALEMGAAGMLGSLNVSIVEGPEEYLFGEEKALLEVIEGRDPLPTLLPPWQRGLFATVQLGWEADVGTGAPERSEQSHAGEQRRDAGERGAHPGAGRDLVPFDGHRPTRRARFS